MVQRDRREIDGSRATKANGGGVVMPILLLFRCSSVREAVVQSYAHDVEFSI